LWEATAVVEPTAYGTVAKRVVFFEDRAEVTRTSKVSVTDGHQWVRLTGASLMLDDRSVQARAAGDRVKVLSARVIRRRRDVNTLTPDEAGKLQLAIAEAAKAAALLDASAERVNRRSAYLFTLMQNWCNALAAVPKPGQDSPAADFERAWTTLIARDAEYLERQLDLADQREDANSEHSKRLEEMSRRNITQVLFECFVEVQIESTTTDDIELEIRYRTPCALWRPEHMARLLRDAKNSNTGELEWTTWGVVWHRTGEVWNDVEIAFSTARPAQVADAPNVSDDNLAKRKKTPEEKKNIVVQMREETIAETGARAEAEMPGVDDGGKPLEFTPKGRYNLPDNGQPTRVEISRTRLKAAVARVLLPERAQTAFLKADSTWTGDAPILAGPLRLARGGAVVGRSRGKFVAPGEKFETGFGPEDGIRCKRAVSEQRETAKITGAQAIKRTVTLRLSNLGNEPRELEITERIPVSEIEGLEVKLTETKDWKLDQDGYLLHKLALQPRANVTLEYTYEIRARSNVVLPF
jgi:uncharacterized protein (TIGR02231 family)